MARDGPRSNRDPSQVERKLGLLREPHVRPLTAFVHRLRARRGDGEAVPWFDPDEAGTGARILLLLEAPGPRATGPRGPRPAAKGSGFVSPDNDDPTAATTWSLLREAGIDRRRETVTWNVVPWYVGDGRAIRAVKRADLDEARPALLELLSLLPHLRVAVLLGRKAAAGWQRAGIDLPAIEAPHPSPQVINIRPAARDEALGALVEARRLAGLKLRCPDRHSAAEFLSALVSCPAWTPPAGCRPGASPGLRANRVRRRPSR